MWDVGSWTGARNGKGLENDKDTRGKESEERSDPGELLEDQFNAVVSTVINIKAVLLIHLSPTKPLTRHGGNYEVTRDRKGWNYGTKRKTEMMGALLSKFSRMGHFRSFKGEVFQDSQNVEEFEEFSEESDTFYSEFYNYDGIITIENDSN